MTEADDFFKEIDQLKEIAAQQGQNPKSTTVVLGPPPTLGQKIGLIAVALAFLAPAWFFGVKDYIDMRQLKATGLQAEGRVISLEQKWDTDNNYTYCPHFSFTDAQGETHAFKSSVCSRPASYDVGETVKILYAPAAPEQSARVDKGIWNSITPLIITLGSLFCSAICLIPLFKKRD